MFRPISFACIFAILAIASNIAFAQTESATITGRVTDASHALLQGAEVEILSVEHGTSRKATSNASGIYFFSAVQPGQYNIRVNHEGFRKIDVLGLTVNVQDHVVENFELQIGSAIESVTVNAEAALINTQDATVSTVVDRNFADNLPMNGRSFQSLIELAPGVVVSSSNDLDNGQFNVNGQRAASNYWMVDGVSANIGIGASSGSIGPSNGLSGSVGSFSVVGGTNSLVSVDAMQEFRIQTSTYAPEFGRTPGGQISIVTRSGTNQFHGSAFDYLRNDIFDSNDWFAKMAGLPRPEERQNDFGGTFGGPIVNDRTFFFGSYEGLRLRLPQTDLTTVPDLAARQSAMPGMQPYLNAYPLDPNQPNLGDGVAQFNKTFSNSASLDAYSLRIDHKLKDRFTVFGRYDYSPSGSLNRGGGDASPLSNVDSTKITTETGTLGTTWSISPVVFNDFRINYSRVEATSSWFTDNFGGAQPLTMLGFPTPFNAGNSFLSLVISSLPKGSFNIGKAKRNIQRQINIVDATSVQRGSHSLKFGIDFRRLSPLYNPPQYAQSIFFSDVPSAENGTPLFDFVISSEGATFLFRNLGTYAQDTWRVLPRLTLTYGLRWDIDFVPHSLSGPALAAASGFDLSDLSKLRVGTPGTPIYDTRYSNFAPRIGVAYQLRAKSNWQTVARGGFGVFYDLATSEVGNSLESGNYPFGSSRVFFPGAPFPLDPSAATPPQITVPAPGNSSAAFLFDPHLNLPYTLEWNVALEQEIGEQQTLTATYIGAAGRRLLESGFFFDTPTQIASTVVTNTGTSDYDALQLQFERRLSRGLQGIASYTWAHSIDTSSAGSGFGDLGNLFSGLYNRGNSSFDIRHTLSVGATYQLPLLNVNRFANQIMGGWSVESVLQTRSASPVDILDYHTSLMLNTLQDAAIRPDVVPGVPLYLYGPQFPGHKALNPAAFTDPPVDPNTGNPLRQGTLGKYSLRGFGATQWDFAVHRIFPMTEAVKLQFRAELFNVLNHPNFSMSGPPTTQFNLPGFGISTEMLNQALNNSNLGGGGFSPLYQLGGPRSVQFALKLMF